MTAARQHAFQAPTGTRDWYPGDLLVRRYIEKMWRDVSVRHGFEEIDGPTFEHLDLYTIKSGEGIVSELFAFRREGGEKDYALRPEFTPTLARMYAARAASLPRPTKWFTTGPFFRAERPQRGRLREFLQWNVDVIGDGSPQADAETIACAVALHEALGLTPRETRVKFNHRGVLGEVVSRLGVPAEHVASAFVLLDRREKMSPDQIEAMAFEFGMSSPDFIAYLRAPRRTGSLDAVAQDLPAATRGEADALLAPLRAVEGQVAHAGVGDWCVADLGVARGLAYYTGMVFEVIAQGERAVAGGGRYDNLVELFGGPPTPAVGFGMGDVVLSHLLRDRGLMPDEAALRDILSRPPASLRPDAFVISGGADEAEAQVRPLVGRLRRGVESGEWLAREGRKPWDPDRYTVAPLHARASAKATKNVGKLLKEAADSGARAAVIVESASHATVRGLATRREQRDVPLVGVAAAAVALSPEG